MHLQEEAVTLLDSTDRLGNTLPLNAWAYDFFKHGSLNALIEDNGVSQGPYMLQS